MVERRLRIVEELKEPFVELHGRISGHGDARLSYRTQLDVQDLEASYAQLLADARRDEIRRGMNLVGPQRDDLVLQLDGRPARAYASQGQTRSLVLALKLAELLAARERGARPLFLLDDLSSELDRFRTGRLVELLEELELQVLVTTTDPSVLDGASELLRYRIDGGTVEA
jgi:DNA replication and repair protein RecF